MKTIRDEPGEPVDTLAAGDPPEHQGETSSTGPAARVDSTLLARMAAHLGAATVESAISYTAPGAALDDLAMTRSGPISTMTTPEPVAQAGALRRTAVVGRYIILEPLGQGGMGAVYAAYDPELDRRVALKLLRAVRKSAIARKRLEREARALAKLGHPNVVQVFDAGVYQDAVFITMELVDGQSMQQWQSREPRPPWREVLAAYLDAARGIAAAHAAGLVHRDVKPANILRGKDGRIRVADFGLAAAQEREPEQITLEPDATRSEHSSLSAGNPEAAGLGAGNPEAAGLGAASLGHGLAGTLSSSLQGRPDDRLTIVGAMMGTPAFMAPEQFTGGEVGPAADQYGLCIALYQGLYGKLPFATKKTGRAAVSELMRRKVRGESDSPPASSPVPGWVHRALVRGMASRPEDRYPSMEALIAVLGDDPSVRRRVRVRWAVVLLVTLSLAIAAALGWVQSGALRDACGGVPGELAGAWDRAVKARMQRVFLATERGHAADTARRVGSMLDDYAGAWARMRMEVCRARQQGESDHDVLALRDVCLERRRQQLGALTEVLFAESSPAVLDKATGAVQSLYPIEYCADVEALSARVRPPEDPRLRARVEALQPRVARLEALRAAGKYRAGSEEGEALLAEVAGLSYLPLRAEVLYWTGYLHLEAGEHDKADAQLRQAILVAAEGRDDQLVANAWLVLFYLRGEKQRRFADAEQMAEWLPVAVKRAGDVEIRSRWLTAMGLLRSGQGRHDQAKRYHEQALALLEAELGPEHRAVGVVLNNLGVAYHELGRYGQSRGAYERVLAIREALYGPGHPSLVGTLNNLALVLHDLGQYPAAMSMYERALAILASTTDVEHVVSAAIASNQAKVLLSMGRYQEAAAREQGAAGRMQAVLGAEHPHVAQAHAGAGRALVGLRQLDAAVEHLERALAIQASSLGAEHPDLADTLLGLGEASLARNQPAEAAVYLERALALQSTRRQADIELVLARALWAQGQDRARALEQAQKAHAFFGAVGNQAKRAEAAEWLQHRQR